MPFDAFLKIDGVPGESTDKNHAREIEILAVKFGGVNPSSISSGSTGSGSGRVSFSNLQLTKFVDKSSPVLLQKMASGEFFPTAVLTIRKAGGKSPLEYLTYYLYQVYVSSWEQSGNSFAAEERIMETVELSFARVHLKYIPQRPDGTGDSPIEGGWNLTTNSPG